MASPEHRPPSMSIELLHEGHPNRQAALRLLVSDGAESAAQVSRNLDSLLDAVRTQGMCLDLVVSACLAGRLAASSAVIESPGRTGLMVLGIPTRGRIPTEWAVAMLAEARRLAWERDLVLLQSLVAPEDTRIAMIHRDGGFQFLAELIYLECKLSESMGRRERPPGLSYLTYLPSLEPQFIAVLEQTYRESLDCPGLNGIRDTADVLIGHKHTGISAPEALWFLAMRGDTPVGVLLLSEVHNRSCLEIVYMGVVVEARGQGIGDALLSLANEVARRRGASGLTLAVDGANVFAHRAYARWGFAEVGRRRAWICRRPQ